MKTIADMTESEAKALLNEIADKFSIGSKVRTGPTILANFENTLRRERCLSMIERHHTVTVLDEDGEELRDCLLNWGENPEKYIRTYRSIIGAQHRNEIHIAELEAERDRLQRGLHPHHTGALERAIARLDDEAKRAAQKGDYDAMLPEGDAVSLREVRDLLVRTDTEDDSDE